MTRQRWLRLLPVALLMYTISYVDRTNISLALDPRISSLMPDLSMDDKMKGQLAGIFFIGYVLMQIPGGYLASRWSARKLISLCLIAWGLFAMGCGFSKTFREFEAMRFFLGVAESAVFPATYVLMMNWFSRSERARANAYWLLCQPLAVAASAPLTGWLLGRYGWQLMLILEGILPFIWLPIWWFCIRDYPREVKWLSPAERRQVETILKREADELEPPQKISWVSRLAHPSVFIMITLYFLHNCAAYGCMTFFTDNLKGRNFNGLQYGILFAIPYAVTMIVMVANSWHSDKTHERRGHVAAVYVMSGASLILSVVLSGHFWVSYVFMCLAIPGPFAAMAPFWAISAETLPRTAMAVVIGIVNAFGNLGGFAGPYITGWLENEYHSITLPFIVLGFGMLGCVVLAYLLPKTAPPIPLAAAE
ncbi:MAG TPA: MFS transporter [Verrucomicrobiae bacterium]|nr:MFS transporter [Verrucomicrobiae bacterium]